MRWSAWTSTLKRPTPQVAGTTAAGTPEDSIHDLVTRLKSREERALREFFEHHSRTLERLLLRVLGPDPDLADVVQDSFEQALLSIHRFHGTTEQLGAWLHRIALNVAKNLLRHRRIRGWLRGPVSYGPYELAARTASPEVVDAMRRTYEVLARLPAQERTVFALRFIDGMRLTEVAEMTEVSLATVKRQLARARKRFERHARKDPFLVGWFPEEGP